MLKMYDLLPAFYRAKDAELGYPLRTFLEPLQDVLDRIYADEKVLRTIQDPRATPEEFLRWIAASLAWVFISEDTDSQRNEALEIVNFYDLKGTPYAIRLLASLTMPKFFDRLVEYFPGGAGSISATRENWAHANPELKNILAGQAVFGDPAWLEEQLAVRGRPYDFTPENRMYHYFVFNDVLPGSFVEGELREAVLRYISQYRKFHPAGRYGYLYFRAPSAQTADHGATVIAELVGGVYWDLGWSFDTEKRFDTAGNPVHPSVSWRFPWTWHTFDIGRVYDSDWTWDAGDMNAHVLIELD